MVISHRHRFLFVEVPHTGSHSISSQLVAHYGGRPILRKHANVTQFLANATADERSYFKFATVRNPLEAAATDYAKLRNNHKGQFTNPAMLIENGGHVTKQHLREFAFIAENDADFGAFFKKFRGKLYNNWFLVGYQHFDYIVRFEELQRCFSEVLLKLHIDEVEPLPHVNRTAGKGKTLDELFTPDIRALAAACYGPFMQKWGYPLPASWGDVKVPRTSRLQFAAIDGVGRILSHWLALDPDNPTIHRAKRVLDWATRKKR